MKPIEVKQRIAGLATQIIAYRLAEPPTAEELDWLKSMAEMRELFQPEEPRPGDEAEYRRLFWELQLGIADWSNEPLQPEDFISQEAYDIFLQTTY